MSGAPVSQRLPVLALLGASLIWGLTWLPLKLFEASGLGGAALLLVAHGAVALVALPLLARQRRVLLPEWRTLAGVFCLGGFATIAFSTSLMYGDVVRAMSLFYTMPLWAILGGLLFLGERLTRRRALAALCAIAGAWLILGGTRILERPPGWIDLLAAASGFAYAMNNVVFRATPALAVTPKILMMYLGVAVFCALLLLAGVQHWPVGAAAGVTAGAGLRLRRLLAARRQHRHAMGRDTHGGRTRGDDRGAGTADRRGLGAVARGRLAVDGRMLWRGAADQRRAAGSARLMTIGLALWSGMTALSGLAKNGMHLAVARIGVCVGEATCSPCAYSLLSDYFPREKRATMLAIYASGGTLGAGLALGLGGAIVGTWNQAFPGGGPLGLVGWQAAFMAVGLPGAHPGVLGRNEGTTGRPGKVLGDAQNVELHSRANFVRMAAEGKL